MALLAADDGMDRGALKADERDLFSAVTALGQSTEEWDVEGNAYASQFRRTEEWQEALAVVRKCVVALSGAGGWEGGEGGWGVGGVGVVGGWWWW